MRNMGGMMSMLDKLPGVSGLPDNVKGQLDDKLTVRMEAIINSMTKGERRNPDIIKGSRKKRIAMGSGTEIQDVNRLLKQFDQMQKMMKKVAGKGGLRKMMGNMKNMLPPGGFGRGGF
jgi:signal recognition particle subunit SRP54